MSVFLNPTGNIRPLKGVQTNSGTTDTITSQDWGYTNIYTASSAVAITLNAIAGNAQDAQYPMMEIRSKTTSGAIITITPTSGTINGQATLVLQSGDNVQITEDGTNYFIDYLFSRSSNPQFFNIGTAGAIMIPNSRYLVSYGLGTTLQLPASSAIGDVIQVMLAPTVLNATTISQASSGASSSIYYLGVRSTVGVSGSIAIQNATISTGGCVSVSLICTATTPTWMVTNALLGAEGIIVT